ncbi:MAG: MCP four helix bundle domain-containing protein [Candidatus Methanoperedens sp.]|nr:MCP four helix bundle domain-containing protein [Candidatus Methanoperedens sp.]
MKIKQKIILSFLFVSILVIFIGFIGLYSNNIVIESFKTGEERFGPIISSSNEVSSFAKRAEGHAFLYITLHNKSDRKKAFERITSLRKELRSLEQNIKDPDAIALLNVSKSNTDKMESIIEELFKLHDNEMENNGTFDYKNHETLILKIFQLILIMQFHVD